MHRTIKEVSLDMSALRFERRVRLSQVRGTQRATVRESLMRTGAAGLSAGHLGGRRAAAGGASQSGAEAGR